MIYVMPSGFRSYYVNRLDGNFDYMQMFAEELVPYVDRTYRTLADRGHRAVVGYSMGTGSGPCSSRSGAPLRPAPCRRRWRPTANPTPKRPAAWPNWPGCRPRSSLPRTTICSAATRRSICCTTEDFGRRGRLGVCGCIEQEQRVERRIRSRGGIGRPSRFSRGDAQAVFAVRTEGERFFGRGDELLQREAMFIVESYSLAIVFCFVTMLCWGSWGNTQKLAQKSWRYELFSKPIPCAWQVS